MNRAGILSGILVMAAIPFSSSVSGQFVVNTTSDTVIGGACAAGASGCSLRGAVMAANADPDASTITFAIPTSDGGCSAGVCTISLGTVLQTVTTNIAVNGPGPTSGSLIIRAATGTVNVHIFSVSSAGVLSLSYLTLTNGQNAGSGGAVYNPNGTLNITNCTIAGNQAIHGGTAAGVYNGGTLNVVGSTFRNNSNTTGNGGAIVNHGTANVVNTTISGNSGNTNGGGISNAGTLNVTNSTIIGNTAQIGGSGMGGGIFNSSSGTATIKNTIIALNAATNAGPDVHGAFVSPGFNIIGKRDGSSGFTTATDQTGTIAAPLNPVLGPLQDNGGPTHTAAVLQSSPALDKGTSLGLTGTLLTDQRGAGFVRTFDNPSVPNAAGGDGTDIGAYERQAGETAGAGIFDFDADGKTDLSIWRPAAQSQFWMHRSSNGTSFAAPFGTSTDVIVPADFTGDRRTDAAFFRPSTGQWFVLRSEDFSFYSFPFGVNGDIPMPADFDADGKADAAVFRPAAATWFINKSTGGTETIIFGASGDLPAAADYDGDSRADIAVYRPSAPNGAEWWLRRSSNGSVFATVFGKSGDRAVPGDYTGDGKVDIASWRPSDGHWYILRSENLTYFAFALGTSTDVPVPGDYDGDGRNDGAVFRPSTGTWYANRANGSTLIQQFGTSGDVPLPSAFVR